MIDPQGPSGAGQLGEIPYLRLPRPELLFARRAERFAALAPGHTLSEYLELLARLARAQLTAWETHEHFEGRGMVPPAHPERSASAGGAESRGAHEQSVRPEPVEGRMGDAPSGSSLLCRSPSWRDALRVIVTELSATDLPIESRRALDRLSALAPEIVEPIADRVLASAAADTDLAVGPFVAAALQVHFSGLAAGVDPARAEHTGSSCPVCGSPPVTGVVLGDDRLRYLVCTVCATQWHHVRLKCVACGNAEDLTYCTIEGERAASVAAPDAVKAEACPRCRAYTKLFYVEKDPHLEPFADDVATLALDLLMAENGWARHGVNVLLMPPADSDR